MKTSPPITAMARSPEPASLRFTKRNDVMTERSIDPVSEAIGALKTGVQTILTNQNARETIDADFRREVRASLSGVASSAALAAQAVKHDLDLKETNGRVTDLEKKHDRVRNILTGA